MESMYKVCFYGGLALAVIFLIASIVLFIVLKIPKVIGDLTGRNAKKSIDAMKNKKIASSEVSRKEQAKYYNQGTGKIKVKEAVSPATRKANRDDTTDLLDSDAKGKAGYDEEATDVLGSDAVNTRRRSEEETEVLGSGKMADDEEKTDVLRADGGDDDVTDVLRADDGDDDVTDVLRADDGDDDVTDVLRTDDGDDDDVTDVLRSTEEDTDEEATDILRATAATEEDDDEPATDVLRTETITPKKKHSATVIYDIVITHTEEKI